MSSLTLRQEFKDEQAVRYFQPRASSLTWNVSGTWNRWRMCDGAVIIISDSIEAGSRPAILVSLNGIGISSPGSKNPRRIVGARGTRASFESAIHCSSNPKPQRLTSRPL
jgi:hypothetical protein